MAWTCPCGTSNGDNRQSCRACNRPLFDHPRPEAVQRAPEQAAQYYPLCKVCERGALVPRRVYRMSGPVVAIGFILLIPPVLGMIVCGLMFLGVTATSKTPDNATILAGGLSLGFGIACFVSGLLGWLLIMKKRVLQCAVCGAVIGAS